MKRIACLAFTSLLLLAVRSAPACAQDRSTNQEKVFAKLTGNSKTTTPPLKSFKTKYTRKPFVRKQISALSSVTFVRATSQRFSTNVTRIWSRCRPAMSFRSLAVVTRWMVVHRKHLRCGLGTRPLCIRLRSGVDHRRRFSLRSREVLRHQDVYLVSGDGETGGQISHVPCARTLS